MIRINLLPGAREAAKGAEREDSVAKWAFIALVSVALVSGVLYWFYLIQQNALEAQVAANKSIEKDVQRLVEQTKELDRLKEELDKSEQLEQAVSDLNPSRYGPTKVLLELSRILSIGGGPKVDPQRLEEMKRVNPLAGYNAAWDPRRLWIRSFKEDSRACTIEGIGKTNDDVAEFLQRLRLSEIFDAVELRQTDEHTESNVNARFARFSLTCKVRY